MAICSTETLSETEKPAEGVGFEPTGTCIPRLFKSLAFGRSATPPDGDDEAISSTLDAVAEG
jgi:hypothetical protein